MATGKVILEQGFTRKGKAYAKGDDYSGNKAELEQLERLGYVKLSGEGTASKGAAKSAAKKGASKGKKSKTTDVVSDTTATPDVTE